MITIGVDPGKRVGVAVIETHGPVAHELWTVADRQAGPFVLGLALYYACPIVIEEPQAAHVYQRPGQSPAAMRKIARNVGECRQRALALAEQLEKALMRWNIIGVPVKLRPPVRGGTKWTRERFEAVFGWTGPSSDHARDAAVIAMQGGE